RTLRYVENEASVAEVFASCLKQEIQDQENFAIFFGFVRSRLPVPSRNRGGRSTQMSLHLQPTTPAAPSARPRRAFHTVRATNLAARGYLKRATQTLLRTENSTDLKTAAEAMLDLHPSAPLPHLPPIRPTQLVAVDPEVLERLLYTSRGLKAPGVSGWTEELLYALRKNPKSWSFLVFFVEQILNGTVPSHVAATLRRCRLVPLRKQDGGFRPVAIGETISKLAAIYLLSLHTEQIRNYFEPRDQFCFSLAGTEHIIHRCRKAVIEEQRTIGTLDFTNAFNSVSRQTIARLLYADSKFEKFWPIFSLLYCNPSELIIHGFGEETGQAAAIYSTEGTRQGDPLSPLFFCLVMETFIAPLRQLNLPTLQIFAYMDDLTLVGNAEEVQQATALMTNTPMKINFSKSTFFGPGSSVLAATMGCTHSPEGVKLLGAWIGSSCLPFVRTALAKHTPLFERLTTLKDDNPSVALTLLRACGLPRWVHITRTHDPTETLPVHQEFDRLVLQLLCAIAGMEYEDLTDQTRLFAHLPIRKGGVGITSYARIAKCNFDASASRQKNAQQFAVAKLNKGLLKEASKEMRTHAKLCSKKYASLWLSKPFFTWTVSEFSAALRLRMGTFVGDSTVRSCVCEYEGPNIIHHVLGCARTPGIGPSSRHHLIVKSFIKWGAPRGIAVTGEPEVGDGKRGDLLFILDSGLVVADVTVSSSRCTAHSEKSTAQLQKEKEFLKRRLYGARARRMNAFFETFHLEAMGGMGKGITTTVRRLTNDREDRLELLRMVSTSLQRGNALIVLSAMRRGTLVA
ncbi:MAG: reverse transcriptase domain-containing protein, partial [Rhabdochlamydiaceae bacterium]